MQLPTVSHRHPFAAIVAAAFVMMLPAGCSAHGRAGDGQDGEAAPMQFACSSEPLKAAAADVQEAAVCGLFKAEIERALGRRMTDAATTDGGRDWVRVSIRASGPVTVSALVVQQINGLETTLPDMAVDVSDRPVGLSDIEMLATQVARTVAEAAGQ